MAMDVPAEIQVYDGDTFRVGQERIRILNIDAPEMGHRAKCQAEAFLAQAAKERLSSLIVGAGRALQIERDGKDRYGRTLAVIRVSGSDVGEMLILAHLAVKWRGKRADWCGGR